MDRMRHAGHAYHRQKVPDENISAAGYRRVEDPKVAYLGLAVPGPRSEQVSNGVWILARYSSVDNRSRGYVSSPSSQCVARNRIRRASVAITSAAKLVSSRDVWRPKPSLMEQWTAASERPKALRT